MPFKPKKDALTFPVCGQLTSEEKDEWQAYLAARQVTEPDLNQSRLVRRILMAHIAVNRDLGGGYA